MRDALRPLCMFVAVAMALIVPAAGQAQCTGSRAVGVSPGPALIQFGAITASDFDAGYALHPTILSVEVTPPNQGQVWELCVQASTPALGAYGGSTKPISDLEFSVDGGPWTPLSATRIAIHSDRRTLSVPIRVRVRLDWASDAPGSYGTLLTFHATM